MKRSVLLSILVLCSASYSYAQQEKTLNIALIADKAGGLDKSPLISLLEVRLSQKANIKLLERAQIDKILQEQQLTAAGLLDRNNTIKLGQILRADAFVIISSENTIQQTSGNTPTASTAATGEPNKPTGSLIRVRLTETAHGLRLSDRFEQLDNSKLDEIAEAISKNIDVVIGKLSLPAGQAIPVGIVDIHRVQLGEKHKILERALPVLLSVRLALEPKIIMLEREDLKTLLNEKFMTQGDDSKFWGSAVLIEGNLQPKNGDIEMTFSLRRVGEGTKSFTVPIDPNEPSVAINKAAADIVQEILNAPPSAQWQLAQEAEHFYQQGRMLAAHNRIEDAIIPLETAYALQPHNINYIANVFEQVWDIRRTNENILRGIEVGIRTSGKLGICPYSDIEIAEFASVLVRRICDGYDKGQLSAYDIGNTIWLKYFQIHPNGTAFTLGQRYYFSSTVSIATEQVRLKNRETRKTIIEILDKSLKNLEQNPPRNPAQRITDIPLRRAQLVWLSTDEPNELMANIKKAFAELIMPPKMGGKIQSESDRYSACGTLLGLGGPLILTSSVLEVSHLKGSSEKFMQLWQEYLKELAEVDDFVLKINSITYMLRQVPNSQDEKDALVQYYYKAIAVLDEELKKPNKTFSTYDITQLKIRLFDNVSMPLRQVIGTNSSVEIWKEFCGYLIEQKDIDSLVKIFSAWRLPNSLGMGPGPNPELHSQYYLLLERVAEILKTRTGDKQTIITLNNIKHIQAVIRGRFPYSNFPQTAPTLPVKILLTKQDLLQNMQYNLNNSIRSFGVTLKDEVLWITLILGGNGNRDSEGNIQWPSIIAVAGFNLSKNKLITLWQSEISFSQPSSSGTLVFCSESSYLCTNRGGIVELPSSLVDGHKILKNPKVLTQKDGLPSLSVTSIAQDGDKIWVAYGGVREESGLSLYDTKTGKWETIFCSTLKDNPPFSAGQPYQIGSMIYVQPNKLYFYASGMKQSERGFWRMDTNTHELKYISSIQGELTDDLGANLWLKRMNPRSRTYGLREDMFLTDSFLSNVTLGPYVTQGNLDLSTGVVHNNKLWAKFGRGQILIIEKGKSFEEARFIDNNILNGVPVERFVSTPYGLIAIGEGTVGLIKTE